MYFKITYSCGCGSNEEYIKADSYDEAVKNAYYLAVETYESYAGYHGIPSVEEVAEDMFEKSYDELTPEEARDAESEYYQEMESWLSYDAEEVSAEEFNENF